MLKELYHQYKNNSYRVILTTGYSHLNEFRDLKNDHAYAIAKKPVGSAWQKSEGVSYEKAAEWIEKGGWIAAVLPDHLIAVDVDGNSESQEQYAMLNKRYADKCGIHKTNNGRHYIYMLPRDQAARERIKSTADVLSRCGLLLTYRIGGKSNIIIAPSNGRTWEVFRGNEELMELPAEFQPIDLKDAAQVEKAMVFQLGQAYKSKLLQGNEHIDMMLMGALVKNLNYDLPQIEKVYGAIYQSDYNAAQTRANYERAKKLERAQGAKSLFGVLKEKGLQNIELLLNALLNVSAAKSATHATKEKGPSSKEMNLSVEAYIRENKVIYKETDGAYYRYENGLFVPLTLQSVLARFQKILTAEHASPQRLNHMKSYFLNYFEENKHTEDDELKLLTANDKVIDLQSLEVRERRENEVFFNRLNVNYNPLAKTVRWDKFLLEIFPGRAEIIPFLQEFMGYSLTLMTKFEMALVFRGEGANGKSVLLHVWEYILGKHNISNLSMTQLSGEYTQVMLQNKLLNICHEIGIKEFIPEATLKKMISGEEITVNRKYKDAITFKPYAKLVFSSNNHVLSLDKSNGTTRRYVFIPFTVDFESPELKSRKDPDLKYQLVREEGDGVFMWALAGLRRLLARGGFDVPFTLIEHTKKENNETNPIYEFANEYIYWGSSGDFITSKRLYNEYKKFCLMYGYGAKAHGAFTIDFKRLFRNAESLSIIKNNNRGFCCMLLKEVPYNMQKREYEPENEEPTRYQDRVHVTKMTWKEYNDTKKEKF